MRSIRIALSSVSLVLLLATTVGIVAWSLKISEDATRIPDARDLEKSSETKPSKQELEEVVLIRNSTFISARLSVFVLWNLDSSTAWKPKILELKKEMLQNNTYLIVDLERSTGRLQSYCNLPGGYAYCTQEVIGEIHGIPEIGIYKFTDRAISNVQHSITFDEFKFLKDLLDAKYGYTLSGGNSFHKGYYGFVAYNGTTYVINLETVWSVP